MQLTGYSRAEAVVPADLDPAGSVPAFTAKAIYVAVAGNITLVPSRNNGVAVAFLNVPVGILFVQAARVNLTGTTATGLVWLGD